MLISTIRTAASRTAGIIDVALLSASNFLISVFLIRYAGELNYATYVNAFSGLMLLSTIQNAFLQTQISVAYSKISDIYEKRLKILSVLSLGILSYAALIVPTLMISNWIDINLLLAAYASHATYLFRDLLRISCYTDSKRSLVLISSLGTFAVLVIALLLLKTYNQKEINFIFFAITASNLFGITLILRGMTLSSVNFLRLLTAAKECWSVGKWNLLGSIATWAQNNSYTFLTTYLLGLKATASLAAARLLLMPINVVASGIYIVEKPTWSKLFETDRLSLTKRATRTSFAMCIFVTIFASGILLITDQISNLLGKELDQKLIFLWATAFFVQSFKFSNSNILIVGEHYRYLARIGIPISVLTIALTFFLAMTLNIYGIVIAYALGELLHWCATKRKIKAERLFA